MSISIRVLIVEDQEADAELIVRELRRSGFEPDWQRVETETEYLARLNPNLDVILADYTLPSFDAPQALRLRNEREYDIPFIIISGTIGEIKAVNCIKLGAADYLLKDRLGRLGTAVKHAVDAKKLRQEKLQAEKLMCDREHQLETLMSNLPGMAYRCLYDQSWTMKFISEGCEKLTGYKAVDLIDNKKLSFRDLIHQDDKQMVREQVQKSLAKQEHYHFDYRINCAHGVEKWISERGIGILQKTEEVQILDGFIYDISDRVNIEMNLRESEEKYRSLFESSIDGIFLTTLDGKISDANPGACRMLNMSKEEICRAGRQGLLENNANLVSGLKEREQTGRFSGELTFVRKDGSKFIAETNSVIISDKAGFKRAVAIVRDITERKLSENALRESEARYRTLIENIPQAVLLKDRESKYISINTAYALAFGLRQEEVIGKSDYDFHPKHLADKFRQEDRLVMEAAEYMMFEEEHVQGGKKRIYDKVKVPVRDGMGKIIGVLSTLSDITQRKRSEEEHKKLEAQFRQAQKMEAVGRLSGGVAHDFNNMLGVIMGFTELAIMKLPVDDPIQMYLDEVRTAAQRSADITRQLLAFARKQIIVPKALDLNDTIPSMLKMLRRLIGEDIDLLWKPAKDLWPVKMDPAQIDQVLANLMVNARDAIAGVGKITISTGKVEFDEHYCENHVGSAPGRYVLLAVSDDGCGMDKETLSKLFEPFFTTKEIGKGTGLGLATIYGIVKQNNGFIDVYSEPGHGTTFKIYLPRQEPQEAATEQPHKPAEVQTGTETVLLVEDEKSLLKFARMLLEELGYTVLAAGSPREAIQLAKEYTNEIHLLMTDVVMPKMSGRELCVQLEASRPSLKCLYMSGYTADVIAHQGVLDEGVYFLQKPFSRETLATKVREALS
jgi:PAS domain S-box-containing protein